MREPSVYHNIRNRIVQSALMSPQTASIVLVAVAAFAFDVSVLGAPAALWLVAGGVAVAIFVLATLGDAGAAEAVLDDMARSTFNPDEIRNTRARQRLQQALEYLENIRTIAQQRGGAMRLQLNNTAAELNDWIAEIHKIARRIDLYEENSLLSRDLARVPDELKMLHQRLETESDPAIQGELQESIRLRETQLENLKLLENNIKRADIQLDNTVTAMGTVFAQVQLIDARDVDSRRTDRLRANIRDEVSSLRDTIDAIDEVHQSKLSAAY